MAPWTGPELAEFKRLYGGRPDGWLAEHFACTEADVAEKAAELALSKNKAAFAAPFKMPRWTPEAVALLRERYDETSNLELARLLGRSIKSVVSKAHNLGLRKSEARLKDMGRENVMRRWGAEGDDST